MSSKYHDWLAFAKKIAIQAGSMILEARQTASFERDYKLHHELVTSTDVAVDAYLCAQIQTRYPQHTILSEETFPDVSFDSLAEEQVVWVIDPIDGTVNFAHGHKHVAVSIGLFIGSQRILGVVHAPFLQETYYAVKNGGAFCNEQPIQVSHALQLRNALVATGFPYQKDALPELIERLSRVLAVCQDVRRNGSAALDLCWVAAGRLDAYYESVKPWDMAAGALIAEEAGARVGHFLPMLDHWPEVISGEALLVATPELYESLLATL
ncbi:inositol monophosphatase family protein [Marinomonas sp. THO17]|uniref:inositol monophosphatase family protein n=1 Tax=Marinomonas sp. THO17 TaxID=3149048 RepID=UPI00336C1FAE